MFGESDKTGITAWADVLKASTSITELNLAKNYIDAADATILAPAISDNGAISQIKFGGDSYDSKPVTMETSMVEADFSGKVLGVSGAIMVGAFLPKCT
jgi:hypothetical protein